MVEMIRETTFRELTGTDMPIEIRVVGQEGGYAINVLYGSCERILANTRGGVRLFSLESAGTFLGRFGIRRFEVDSTAYSPGRLRAPRPDRSEALKKTRTTPQHAQLL